MHLTTPRLVIAGLAGDSGKTLVTLGLARALTARGLEIAPFKKGPDYIDAAWLGFAASGKGRNLDTFLMSSPAIGAGLNLGLPADLILVEGNRGLYDGLDSAGSHSTAQLAKLLGAPVILVVDVTKMTRTTAALVLGCQRMDPDLHLAGVVLNRVGTERQEKVIREALQSIGGPPVIGAIPRLAGDLLPGRHLGLVTAAEHPDRKAAIAKASSVASDNLDLNLVMEIARKAEPVEIAASTPGSLGPPVRLAVFRDEALSFYYPENLEALENAGAELEFVSPLDDTELPDVDGLYFGGGFPEVHIDRLADNIPLKRAVKEAADSGMPVYAECGGLMYLARELIVAGGTRAMTGVLDIVVEHTPRPCGHGYVEAEVEAPNPFFEHGTRLRGHEFHYSRVVSGIEPGCTVLRLHRGQGTGDNRDGIVASRVWASYMHIHALGTPSWARSLTSLARRYRKERLETSLPGAGTSGDVLPCKAKVGDSGEILPNKSGPMRHERT